MVAQHDMLPVYQIEPASGRSKGNNNVGVRMTEMMALSIQIDWGGFLTTFSMPTLMICIKYGLKVPLDNQNVYKKTDLELKMAGSAP